MAINISSYLLASLKTYYAKEGLANLLYANDAFLKTIKKESVSGKEQRYAAFLSRGGSVSGDFRKAKAKALETVRSVEFVVEPGMCFSGCTFNNLELLASRDQKGAYLPIATQKVFGALESFRKTLANSLYKGSHGRIYTMGATESYSFTQGTEVDITLPNDAIMAIDIDSDIEFKTAENATTVLATATVKRINGATVTVTPDTTASIPAATVLCIAGCTDAATGEGLLPKGLNEWIPETLESGTFAGVDRSVARDRLAGTHITAASGEKKYETIERALLELQRHGSKADVIIMNAEDRLALAGEIRDKTYFTKVNGGTKGQKAEIGTKDFGFSVDQNYLDNVISSFYLEKGKAYILDSTAIAYWTYSMADKINDGAEAGSKPEVNGDGTLAEKPYQLLCDQIFTINQAADGQSGSSSFLAVNFYGQLVVTRPDVNAVITF